MVMNSVVISIGSNVEDRLAQVKNVLDWCKREFCSVRTSSVYETPDYSGKDKIYANAVVIAETSRDIESVKSFLSLKEITQGRNDECRKHGIVPIDLDLVIYNGSVIRPEEIGRRYFTIGYDMVKER